MVSAAGGSGAGGGDRCPSGEKGTTRVGRRSKKPSAFHKANSTMMKYLILTITSNMTIYVYICN